MNDHSRISGLGEVLNQSGLMRQQWKMGEFKAKFASHSTAMVQIFRTETVHFTYRATNHGLFSTALVITAILALAPCVSMVFPQLITAAEYKLSIEHHQFTPNVLEVKAGEKHRLIVVNKDATPEEFESYELNREKIIAGHSKIIIFLPPLDPGEYPFFGDFHKDTAQGRIVAKE